jgi:nucleoside-diphosphate-sugar epimerase
VTARPRTSPRALVTGASGFLGRRLSQQLVDSGIRVRAVMRTEAAGPWDEQASVDLSTGHLPRGLLTGVDMVFHLAGRAHALEERQQPEAVYWASSVVSTGALLEAAVEAKAASFVFMSSAAASTQSTEPRDPRDECGTPETAYGRGKLAAERLVLAAGERHGLHVCNLRPVVAYGSGCRGNIPRMLAAIDHHIFPPVPEVGNRRSMVSAEDVARAAMLVATQERANGRTYHVTDGVPYSTREIYVTMAAALGVRIPPVSVPMPMLTAIARTGDGLAHVRGRRSPFDSAALRTLLGSAHFDADAITAELGFKPGRTFYSALPEMVAGYRQPTALSAVTVG